MVTQTKGRKVQLSVTVRPELKELAEKIAKENNTTPSGMVSKFLEEIARKRTIEIMEEGYRAMAKEHKQFAKLSAKAASEVVPPWE